MCPSLFHHFKATFTAARHLLEIVGGEPRIVLQIGNVTFTAESALHDTEASMGWTTNNSVLPPKLMETRGTEDYLRIGLF
jgi:hypothetical protein